MSYTLITISFCIPHLRISDYGIKNVTENRNLAVMNNEENERVRGASCLLYIPFDVWNIKLFCIKDDTGRW